MVLLLGNYGFCSAQISLENMILKNRKIKEAYKGLDNPLQIKGEDSSLDYTITSSGKNRIIKDKQFKNKFRYSPSYNNRLDTLRIYQNGKIVKEEYFMAKRVPDPAPFVYKNGRTGLSKSQIKASPYLRCWPFEYNLRLPIRIVSFDLTVKDKFGNIVIAGSKNSGQKINKQNLFFIEQQKKGATLYFENIKAALSSDIRNMQGLVIKII